MIDNGKRSVLGVLVDVVDCEAATAKVLAAAREHRPFALTALAVHGVMTGVQDKAHNARLNAFDVVTPDGQPVRWALNSLHGAGLAERVYGPTLTLEVLRGCAAEGLPVYLYGSTADTLDRLVPKLIEMFPALKIAGTEASKFRAVRPGEDVDIAERIKAWRSAPRSTTTPGSCAGRPRGCRNAAWSGCGASAWSRAACGNGICCSTRHTWPG